VLDFGHSPSTPRSVAFPYDPFVSRDLSCNSESSGSWLLSSAGSPRSEDTVSREKGEESSRNWIIEDSPCPIRLLLKSRENDRIVRTIKEINTVLEKMKLRNGLSSISDLTRQIFEAHFLNPFLDCIFKYVKEMRATHLVRARGFEYHEIVEFCMVVILSMFYQAAPSNLYSHGPIVYGLMKKVELERSRFFCLWSLIQKRRIQPISSNCDQFLQDLEDIVRTTCQVCYVDDSIISLDDDKLPFTKRGATELGLKSFKIKERFSAVAHCMVSVNTRLFLGGYLNRLRETARDCVINLVGGVLGVKTRPLEAVPQMMTITMDRGYSHIVFDPYVSVKTIATVKRRKGRSFPFTFCKRKTFHAETEDIRIISMDGNQAIYFARKDRILAAAWRDQNRVTLLETTDPALCENLWEYVPKSMKQESYMKKKQTPAFVHFLPQRVVLTMSQRTPDWFLARRFCLTSSVTYPLIMLMAGGYAHLFNQHFNDPNRHRIRVDLAKLNQVSKLIMKRSVSESFRDLRKNHLSTFTILDLRQIAAARSLTLRNSQRKSDQFD
jgi:hypothetical protein